MYFLFEFLKGCQFFLRSEGKLRVMRRGWIVFSRGFENVLVAGSCYFCDEWALDDLGCAFVAIFVKIIRIEPFFFN